MSKGVHDSSGCARHRSVYVYMPVKGSRVCEHCNVLAVRNYVRASMVQGYTKEPADTYPYLQKWLAMYVTFFRSMDHCRACIASQLIPTL